MSKFSLVTVIDKMALASMGDCERNSGVWRFLILSVGQMSQTPFYNGFSLVSP